MHEKVVDDIVNIFTSEDMDICQSGPGCSFAWVLCFPVKPGSEINLFLREPTGD